MLEFLEGRFPILVITLLMVIIVCCCFSYLICKIILYVYKICRTGSSRDSGHPRVPIRRTPHVTPSPRHHLPIFSQLQTGNSGDVSINNGQSQHVTPPPDYNTVAFSQFEPLNVLPSYQQAISKMQ